MTERDLLFTPHSDMEINDADIVNQHQDLINQNQFDEALNLLEEANYTKGFRASIFNNMENKLYLIQSYLLNNSNQSIEEVISASEPNNCSFWLVDH